MRLGVLIGLVSCSSLLLTIAACGDEGDGGSAGTPSAEVTQMSFDQWKAIELETPKDEIIDEFGEPQFDTGSDYANTISYTLETPNVQVSLSFDPDAKTLEKKVWSLTKAGGGKISDSEYESIENGMTEAEVIALLGEPFETSDEVSTYEYHIGANPDGALQHCLDYTPPGKLANATICFDPTGRVNWKIATKNGKTVDGPG